MFRILVALLLVLSPMLGTRVAQAQRPTDATPQTPRRDRAVLEQRFRERLEQLLRQRLALNDAQFSQLVDVNKRLDGRRRELFTEERAVRQEMRLALQKSDDADPALQERVGQLMERALRLQRMRLDLVETEQRELATFLTPVQRARFLGLQEQLRRRADDMRRRAEGDSLDDPFAIEPPAGSPRRPMRKRPGGEP